MAFAETQKLVVQLDLKGNLNAKLGDAARAIKGFDRATSNTQRSLGKFSSNIQRGVVIGAAAVAGGFTAVVRAAADYESAFAGVRKTVNATEPELKALSDQFRAMSKEIPISASELARLGEAGGALGVPTKQLKEFVRVTALLGVTTNLSADEAADALGVLGNVLHLTGAEYSKFASSLVALGNAGASTERDIVAIAQRAGAAGQLIGVSTEQILGFSSAVASLGIEAEAGGTAIQKFFIDSAKVVAGGGKELAEFAKISGLSAKAFKTAFEKDAGGALQKFLAGLGKLPQAKQLAVLADFGFNDARITRTLLGLANNTKLVSDQMKVANDAFRDNTALTKEAQQRFDTFEAQLKIVRNTLNDAAITIGSNLLPKLTPLLKRLADFINLPKTQGQIAKFGQDLASGFEKFADALQKVDWKPFIDGLKLSSQIAKGAFDLFRSLPKEFQAGLIGAFAVNKVTGGLPTSIVKDVGGALLERFAARGSSPANPMFVLDVAGGGLGGVAGISKAEKFGRIVGTAGNLVMKVAIVGMAAEVASLIAGPVQELGGDIHKLVFGNKGDPLSDFGKAWDDWRKNADWPFGQKNAPAWAGGTGSTEGTGLTIAATIDKAFKDATAKFNVTVGGFDRRVTESPGQQQMAHLAESMRVGRDVWANGFREMIRALKESRSTKDIAAAVKNAVETVVTKGRGSVDSTKATLAGLKAALKNTHDPALTAAIRSAIHKVEAKLPGRAFAAKQIAAANALIRDGKVTPAELRKLQAIERDLKNRGLPHAASVIRGSVEAARRAQVAAQDRVRDAVKRKKLSVTTGPTNVTVPVTIGVSGRDIQRVTFRSRNLGRTTFGIS